MGDRRCVSINLLIKSTRITAGRVEVCLQACMLLGAAAGIAVIFLTYETPQRGLPLWADDAGHECALGRGAVSAVVLFRCCCGSLMMRHIQISV
jgi:hypothetical protein